MSSFTNPVAASAANAAFNAERVAARRDARKRAAQANLADTIDLSTAKLTEASAAGEAAEELPDPPTPGYELLYTPAHGRGDAPDEEGEAIPRPVADPRQIALPFHHIDFRA
ncbi:hypothetical protein [Phycisphaera mikurensis]|uniref:Uncharacterized protein n=1 Tax=Phycisphaera mikurensis (strain NBRC 102666 / KCTC 22515 / FYK2301M01) TaxID=1142394 RepID=I0IAP7_PHYMF|nr:hypothetical protein [Phycisphaera mikurensis]MBB6441670.1 hypothetical protein [Phycisphaera mikurensis]BAM02335.1 hypothetical protein PSMK_01760 [Phycisphaera mikurensis NBRC 102666]